MKQFKHVFNFELKNFIQSKSYILTTVLLSLLLFLLTFIPRLLPGSSTVDNITSDGTFADMYLDDYDGDLFILYDEAGYFEDLSILSQAFRGSVWESADNEDALQQAVQEKDAVAGFALYSPTSFKTYYHDKSITSMETEYFRSVLSAGAAYDYCQENGIDYAGFMAASNPDFEYEEIVLNSSSESSVGYTYVLTILTFIMIMLYGMQIATAVATEKSNRAIEVLVTSCNPDALIAGKVLAASLAGIIQMAVLILAAVLGYQMNSGYWEGLLGLLLDIPKNVLIIFLFFALFGYIFYGFCYGMVGALVSKTEDIGKTGGLLQFLLMIIYMISLLMPMMNSGSPILKVMCFIPFSAPFTVYSQLGSGALSMSGVVISGVILIVSTVLVGFLTARIYRMATLRYGNPISLINGIKMALKKE